MKSESTLDSIITAPKPGKEIRSTYYGVVLLVLTILILFIITVFSNNQIVNFLTHSILGILRLGLIFYGLTLVKKLNRNYSLWSFLVVAFTSISLIILGQLDKLAKELTLIDIDPNADSQNLNNLPAVTLATDSDLLIESVQNESFTLKHMIKNYGDYVKENTTLFPILAAYELNKRDILIDAEVSNSLDKFAVQNGHDSFIQLLDNLKTLTPEVIFSTFK